MDDSDVRWTVPCGVGSTNERKLLRITARASVSVAPPIGPTGVETDDGVATGRPGGRPARSPSIHRPFPLRSGGGRGLSVAAVGACPFPGRVGLHERIDGAPDGVWNGRARTTPPPTRRMLAAVTAVSGSYPLPVSPGSVAVRCPPRRCDVVDARAFFPGGSVHRPVETRSGPVTARWRVDTARRPGRSAASAVPSGRTGHATSHGSGPPRSGGAFHRPGFPSRNRPDAAGPTDSPSCSSSTAAKIPVHESIGRRPTG